MVEELQRPERQQLMRPLAPLVAAALMVIATSAFAETPAAKPGVVSEPAGLYQGGLHGYTPSTVRGGTVLDTGAFVALLDSRHPVLIDVAEKDRKPPTMSKDTPWLPQHRSIPGAIWLQGAGSGTADPDFETAFKTRLAGLTDSDRAKPVVVFCHPDCWASYNAARRLVELGYSQVFWYPEGMEGWQNAHDTKVIRPDAAWTASLPKTMTQ